MTIYDLNNNESVEYNILTEEFQKYFKPDGYERFGQAFYNWGWKKGILYRPWGKLFYCEDNHKANIMITEFLCDYVKK